jgi:hypothetical protein
MSIEATRKVAEYVDDRIEEEDIGRPYFGKHIGLSENELLSFDPENFKKPINAEFNVQVAFIDGGNQEILGAPNFSVQINRIYFNIFKGQTRILQKSMPSKIEFYSATLSCFKHDEIFYDTGIFPLNDEFINLIPRERHLSFSSVDRTVTVGTQRADIERVASIARRFAEWEFAKHVIENELMEGDVVVHDGALQTSLTNEQIYTRRAFETAMKKNVIFTGLSKTSALLTTTGLSLLGAIQKLADDYNVKGPWYFPIAKISFRLLKLHLQHNAFVYIMKLHENASHVFRFEIFGDQAKKMSEEDLSKTISVLVENSKDIAFPGYPYGLIDADRFARVGENEVERYQTLLLSEISRMGVWKKISRHICSGDAHSILDMLKG